MSDLHFKLEAEWSGSGKNGEGTLIINSQKLLYSAPENMGGKGVGISPEELLMSAVTSCYSGTLFGVLKKRGLAVVDVRIETEGIVTGYPLNTKFSSIIVNPVVYGGDTTKTKDYEKAALIAREKCFIGKSIVGNILYEVGRVAVTKVLLD